MLVLEIFEAVLKLGLPVFVVSWWVIRRRYQKGDITPGANHRTVKSNLKKFRKKWRKDEKSEYNLLENKWMRFGGGFYGITALITFMVIELGELAGLFANIADIGNLFSNGVIEFAVSVLVNQILNFITAVIWFTYWADGDRSIFIWVGIPYISYLLAINFASGYDADLPEAESDDDTETRVEPSQPVLPASQKPE
jgi:hypothetical protein